jgi:hypothetical protein
MYDLGGIFLAIHFEASNLTSCDVYTFIKKIPGKMQIETSTYPSHRGSLEMKTATKITISGKKGDINLVHLVYAKDQGINIAKNEKRRKLFFLL